jgi:hypothetical protein
VVDLSYRLENRTQALYLSAAAQMVLASLAMDAMRKGVEGNSTTARKIAR